jgi:hypothetical protein
MFKFERAKKVCHDEECQRCVRTNLVHSKEDDIESFFTLINTAIQDGALAPLLIQGTQDLMFAACWLERFQLSLPSKQNARVTVD